MNKPLKALLLTLTSSLGLIAFSANAQSDEIERVRAELMKMIPPAESAEIIATQADNVYRMEFQGNFAYVYVSGDHVLIGELLNTKDQVKTQNVISQFLLILIADIVVSYITR